MISPQYRPVVGGYERAAERLSVELVQRGHQVTVITERRNSMWPANENHCGVSIRRLPCFYKSNVHVVTALVSFAVYLLYNGRKYGVWHVHQYGMHAALAIAIGKLLRRPVVLKLTNSDEEGLAKTVRNGRFVKLVSDMLRSVSAVVALTRETSIEARQFGIDPDRIHQLGNGVDIWTFAPRAGDKRNELKKRLGFDNRLFVLYVGRLTPEKNPMGLIRAWEMALRNMQESWTLVMVGDGPQCSRLKQSISDAGLNESVIIAGVQDNIEDWMGAADIYVLSSFHEGLSNSLLEAMASGLPVVATRVSGVNDLVDSTGSGLVVEINNLDGIAEALVKLANDAELRQDMGLLARKAIMENGYSIVSVAERHEKLYMQLVQRGIT